MTVSAEAAPAARATVDGNSLVAVEASPNQVDEPDLATEVLRGMRLIQIPHRL